MNCRLVQQRLLVITSPERVPGEVDQRLYPEERADRDREAREHTELKEEVARRLASARELELRARP